MTHFETYKQLISISNKYETIQLVLADMENKEKGDIYEFLCKDIFLYHPEYKERFKNVWLFNETPIYVKELLNIPINKDHGIDIILQLNNDTYVPVQCKFRTLRKSNIIFEKVSTFAALSHSMNNVVQQSIFISNIYKPPYIIKDSKKILYVLGNFFDKLDMNFFNILRNVYFEYPTMDNILIPRLYQSKIISKCLNHFEKHDLVTPKDKGIICMMCGTGKTLTSYFIQKILHITLLLYMVPSLHLLSQLYEDYVAYDPPEQLKTAYILVGSQKQKDSKKIKEMGIMQMILTTDANKIRTTIDKYKKEGKKIIIMSTYQSTNNLIEGIKGIPIDLCFYDECHKTCGIDNSFNKIVRYEGIQKKLFMTATPKTYANKKNQMIDMKNEDVYGKCIFTYPLRQAIIDKALTDYQLYVMCTNEEYIKTYIQKNKIVTDIEFNINNERCHELGSAIMVLNAFNHKDVNHMIIYHNSIQKAKDFEKLLMKLCVSYTFEKNILIQTIEGKQSMNERGQRIRDFTNSPMGILCSCKTLNEGVNIPIIDSVCFVNNRSSQTDIIQCVGRALRLYQNKSIAKILIPTFIENNNYDQLIRVIKAMKHHDPQIIEYFSNSLNNTNTTKKIFFNIEHVSNDESAKIYIENWMSKIEYIIYQTINPWECNFNILFEYVFTHKKYPPKLNGTAEEKKISDWITRQRISFKMNQLSQYKIDKLRSLPNFKFNSDEYWMYVYNKLMEFIIKHKRYPSHGRKFSEQKKKEAELENRPTEESMATWLCKHQKIHFDGKLSDDKIKLLELLPNFIWDTYEDTWEIMYEKLKKFIQINLRYPDVLIKEEQTLANWVKTQRNTFNTKKISDYRITKLNKLPNFIWNIEENEWTINFHKLLEVIKENNDKIPTNGELSTWFRSQRSFLHKKIKSGEILSEIFLNRIKRLESLPNFVWDVKNQKWMMMYNLIKNFFQENKRFPTQSKKERILYNFIKSQRMLYKEGKLDNEKIELLNNLGSYKDESVLGN